MYIETKMHIVIQDVFDEYDKEYYTHVSGKDGILNKESDPEHFKDDEIGNQEVSYGIDFTDWAEWLGMEIDQESFSKYSELDIIGHCLWEVTFYGFIQDDIRKTIDRITNYQSPVERSGQSLPFMAFSSQHEGTYPYIYDEKEIKTGVIVPIRLWEQIRGEIEKGKVVKEEIFNPSEYRGIYKGLRVNLEGEIRGLREDGVPGVEKAY